MNTLQLKLKKATFRKIMHVLFAFSIAINTSLIMINLFEFDDMKTATFNAVCGLLCWIGYYRTKDNGDE